MGEVVIVKIFPGKNCNNFSKQSEMLAVYIALK